MIHIIIFLLSLIISTTATADGVYTPAKSIIQLPTVLNVSGNLQIGQTIWKSPPITTSAELNQPYENKSNIYVNMNNSTLSPYGQGTYSTNIPGIGIRWWATWKGPTIPNGYTEIIEPGNRVEPGKYIASFTDTQTIWVELIKTGSIQQGKLSIASNVEVVYYCPCSNQWAVSVAGVSSVAAAPKCSLSTPIPQIDLGKISTTAFNGVGARSAPVLFSISLTCSGGDPGIGIGSYVTLTDASTPGNFSDILSLSPQSSASGLGIQITNEKGTVKFGPDSTTAGSTNQWKAGDIQPGASAFKIPLRASYIQTGPKVTPGTAIGQANFTLSYH